MPDNPSAKPELTVADGIDLLADGLRATHEILDTRIILTSRSWSRTFEIEQQAVFEAVDAINSAVSTDGYKLMSRNTAEFLITDRGARGTSINPLSLYPLNLSDSTGSLAYTVGEPSLAFCMYILTQIRDLPPQEKRRRLSYITSARHFSSDITVRDALARVLRVNTLIIRSAKTQSVSAFEELATSLFFHLGYNIGLPVTSASLEGTARRKWRVAASRGALHTNLDIPRKKYIPDLVHSYQIALSSESPMLAYLSFYHVAEHWFEQIFIDAVANKVQEKLSSPGFSYRSRDNIRGVIKVIGKELRARDDEYEFDEGSALKLTLTKFVDFPALRDSINALDPSLLDYYASTRVAFADGPIVNLASDPQSAGASLAKRIYSTRNALVHRKSGTRRKFEPFRDDSELEPEIPLVQMVAEQIVINSGSIL